MPKRTNDFQKIVFMIQKILGDNAVVEESALLKDRETNCDVEVDILIQGKVGNTNINIGVECVERSRPSDIEWMRSMLKKHEDLPIDKSVLVSKAGFTHQAKLKAKIAGAETLTFEEAESYEWIEELKKDNKLKIAAFQLTLLSGSVNYEQHKEQSSISTINPESLIFNDTNPDGIKLMTYGTAVVRRRDVFLECSKLWTKIPKEKKGNSFEFDLNLKPDTHTEIELNGIRSHVKSLNFKVKGEVTDEEPLEFETVKFNENVVGYSTFKNIFDKVSNSDRNAVFTMVNKNGKNEGLLSIPDYEGKGDRDFPVNTNFEDKSEN